MAEIHIDPDEAEVVVNTIINLSNGELAENLLDIAKQLRPAAEAGDPYAIKLCDLGTNYNDLFNDYTKSINKVQSSLETIGEVAALFKRKGADLDTKLSGNTQAEKVRGVDVDDWT